MATQQKNAPAPGKRGSDTGFLIMVTLVLLALCLGMFYYLKYVFGV